MIKKKVCFILPSELKFSCSNARSASSPELDPRPCAEQEMKQTFFLIITALIGGGGVGSGFRENESRNQLLTPKVRNRYKKSRDDQEKSLFHSSLRIKVLLFKRKVEQFTGTDPRPCAEQEEETDFFLIITALLPLG